MSKLSFLRASAENNHTQANHDNQKHEHASNSPKKKGGAMAVAVQQQKTRRRKGSLRKVALLGRGAEREKRELETSPLHIGGLAAFQVDRTSPTSPEEFNLDDGLSMSPTSPPKLPQLDGIVDRPFIGRLPPLTTNTALPPPASTNSFTNAKVPLVYTSTTDEDDGLSMPILRPDPATSSADGYFGSHMSSLLTRRRSSQKPSHSSPLALGGYPSVITPLPIPADVDWDYSETEWWGWVVLIVTWIVFVTGMGSCLGVWSWAWDVGETPYAPPELEDDPTLPIVGYYPALIILTGVMAWVWVVVAWVGMKYFRHAKISGD